MPTKYLSGDQIEKNEMAGYVVRLGRGEVHTSWGETSGKETTWETQA